MEFTKDEEYQKAEKLHRQNLFTEAIQHYQRSKCDPCIIEYSVALCICDMAAFRSDFPVLKQCIQRFFSLYDDLLNAPSINDLVESCRRIILSRCRDAINYYITKNTNKTIDECIDMFRKYLTFDDFDHKAHYNLAYLYSQYDAKYILDAIIHYKLTLTIEPSYTLAHLGLANIYLSIGQGYTAIDILKKGLKCKDDPKLYGTLGAIYTGAKKSDLAMKAFEKGLKFTTNDYERASILANMGCLEFDMGHVEKAQELYMKAHQYDSSLKEVVHNICHNSLYFPDKTGKEIRELHEQMGKAIENHHKLPSFKMTTRDSIDNRNIKIGYMSADFCQHAVGFFLQGLFRQRKGYQLYFYFDSHSDPGVTFDDPGITWRHIQNIGTEQVCKMIDDDRIDVLVDLSGHTRGSRLDVFCNRVAPVQISYLGYGTTTGCREMDYFITDQNCDPPEKGDNSEFTEQLVYIEPFFMCYTPPMITVNLKIPCQTNNFITFGSFNKFSKVNDKVIETWCRILKEIPNARLILKGSFYQDFETMLNPFEEYIDRVILIGKTGTYAEHMHMYGLIDIALDTFPYNGITTTCEALYANVPVITYYNTNLHINSVCGSLMKTIGMSEYVCTNLDDYVNLAVQLSQNISRVIEDKQRVREMFLNSLVCDLDHFSNQYHSMIERLV